MKSPNTIIAFLQEKIQKEKQYSLISEKLMIKKIEELRAM